VGKPAPRACCLREAALGRQSTQGQSLGNTGSGSYCFHDAVEGRERKEWFLTKWGRQIKERGVCVYPVFCFFPIVEGNSDEMDGIPGKDTRSRGRLKNGYRTGLQ